MEEWPLVGRASELRRLQQLLADHTAAGVVLAGPVGAGKTRLATEILRLAEMSGAATARATATRSASTVPFGALAALLIPTDQLAATPDRSQLLGLLTAELVRQSGGRRLVLVVDDAHLLDDASATLIHRVVETRAAFVVMIVRSGEAAPDAVVALWKDGLLERIEIGGLQTDAVHRLLEAAFSGPVDGAAAAFFAVRCEGNALFLRELILAALEDGALQNEEGIWRLTREPAPSDRLIEIVENGLRALQPAERTVLEYLAFAEPLGSLELNTLLDAEAAERLESDGLICSTLDGRRLQLRLAHPIYGDVLRSRMPMLRLTKMARALADVVEGTGARRREDTLRVATWRLSGGGGSSPELMLAAAVAARRSYDFPLAERLARFAAQAGAGFEAELLVAQLAGLLGRGEDAESRLGVLAGQAADDDQRSRVTLTRLDNAYMHLQPAVHRRIADDATESITDPDLRDIVIARRSWLALVTEGPKASATDAQSVLQRARGPALVMASVSAAVALGRLGQVDRAVEAADIGAAAHGALSAPLEWDPWVHVFTRSEALATAGRFDEAEALATAEYRIALDERSPLRQAYMAWTLARVNLEQGKARTAARFASEAAALFRQIDLPVGEQHSLVYEVHAHALRGNVAGANQALQRFDALPTVDAILAADLLQAKAWIAVADGDLPAARALLLEAAQAGEDRDDRVGASSALHALVRLDYAKLAVDRLAALAAQMEGDLIAIKADHAAVALGGEPEELERIVARFEAIGAHLLAAEAAADAATLWLKAGNNRRATLTQRRAVTLFEQCEGATSRPAESIETRARLTPAERETALLASRGRSNKQIAEELSVSVRTVESRLLHVYEKLGLSKRDELADAL
ncbi:LuxR family transcriptional regulator [Sporichthya brevicatena]|uniref:LuxR family transcriptional regulator n=1 Tax=Sporichthya brevicatena TaxID=171442 RepID=A0ABN1GIY3_9ACTN